MNSPLENVLQHFPDAIKNGPGWKALCPAHADRNPSLSISEGDNGTVLLKCHAGCTTESVLAAVGLTMADLFPEKPAAVKKKPASKPRRMELESEGYSVKATYYYHDSAGNPVFRVLRYEHPDKDKEFIQQRREIRANKAGWFDGTRGVQKVLYRLPKVLEAIKEGRTVYITEGEKDADTLGGLGLVATCNAGGAVTSMGSRKWLPEYTQSLSGANLVILRDNDDQGLRHQITIARSVADVAASIRLVELPDLLPKGDVSDWIQAGGTREDLESIVSSTQPWVFPSIQQLIDAAASGYYRTNQGEEWWHRLLVELQSYGYSRQDAQAAIMEFQKKAWSYGDYAAEMEAFNKVYELNLNSGKRRLSEASNGLLTIYADCEDLKTVTTACWTAIEQANRPPRYFRRGGTPCRLEKDDDGTLRTRMLTIDRMRYELARIANWKRIKVKNGEEFEIDSKPPKDVVLDVLATPDPPLPVLNRIVEVPVFAPDGSVETAAGYHAAGKVYLLPAAGLEIPEIPKNPTGDDIAAARDTILDLICDFPFIAEADRAHAIALLLLPFVRDLIDGPTPNHLIEAPCPGSGKGLLADALLIPGCGHQISITPYTTEEEEIRKRLLTLLKEAHPAILFDNVTRPIDSGTLAAALTATVYRDRVMGTMESLGIPVRCAWVTTANNPTMSTEIARRSVRIRLDPKIDRPWLREGFKHPNLRPWIWENRGQFIWAALTLTQAWIVAGQPEPTVKPLGTYEQWTRVIGGILQHSGISGFLANLDEFYEKADIEGAIWRSFVAAWWEKFESNPVIAADLFPIVIEQGLFDLGKGSERSQRIRLGKLLVKYCDRVFDGYSIKHAGTVMRASKWMLINTKHQLFSSDSSVNVVNDSECSAPYPMREEDNSTQDNSIYTEAGDIHKHSQHSLDNSGSVSGPDSDKCGSMRPEAAGPESESNLDAEHKRYLLEWGKAHDWPELHFGNGKGLKIPAGELAWNRFVDNPDGKEDRRLAVAEGTLKQ